MTREEANAAHEAANAAQATVNQAAFDAVFAEAAASEEANDAGYEAYAEARALDR